MAQIGIFYGSDTGHTEDAANLIREVIGADRADVFDAAKVKDASAVNAYELVILGTPTWYLGEMQADMEAFTERLADVDLTGKKFALFGLGNQVDYGDYFLDGMGLLYNFLKGKGARILGRWPAEGYDFTSTLAVTDGPDTFVGLALDEDNQPDETPDRVAAWVDQVLAEAGLE